MRILALKQVYRNSDDKTSGGAGSTSGEDGKNNPANEGKAEDGKTSGESKQGNGSQNTGTQDDEKKYTQADIDAAITKRLERERKQQELKQKETQGEFQKLYEEVKPQFDALTAENEQLKTQLKTLAEVSHNSIDSVIEKWPEEIKTTDPGKSNLEVRQKWVEQMTPIALKLSGTKMPNLEPGSKGKDTSNPGLATSFMANRYAPDK